MVIGEGTIKLISSSAGLASDVYGRRSGGMGVISSRRGIVQTFDAERQFPPTIFHVLL